MLKGRTRLSVPPPTTKPTGAVSQPERGAEASVSTPPQEHQEALLPGNDNGAASTPQIGEILMKHGIITATQLQEALHCQKTLKTYKPLGQILIEQRVLTSVQLTFYMEKYRKQLQLSEVLIKARLISESQLQTALEHQRQTGLSLGTVLLNLNYLSEEAFKQALCLQLNIPFVELDRMSLDRSLAKLLNKNYAQRHQVVPISRIGTTLTVAIEDPTDTEVLRELHTSIGYTINVVTSTHSAIRRAFARVYDVVPETTEEAESLDMVPELPATPANKSKYVEEYHENRRADEIVRHLIALAINHRASDIHLDPIDQRMHIRFRIDGMLQTLHLGSLEDDIHANLGSISSRIKIMGKLDIAEKRRPQDGSFRAQVIKDDHIVKIDFRISIVPGHYGESVVLRVLDPRNAPQSIDQLNFWHPITTKLHQLLQRTTGLLLITGPTGSGKSTSLYAALKTLYRPEITVLTAEDPIEYVYDEFTQCEVNDKIGNTFAHYLRAFLRHDPEAIMIGEIRDEETAEMALRAAQTGHLVLSTLHTNDAVGAIPRLRDLRIDANLITSCLLGVLSQRLIRKVCTVCKEPYVPVPDLLHEFFEQPPTDMQWYKGTGCTHCNHTGYKGRMVVAELWIPTDEEVVLINKAAPLDEIKRHSYQHTLLMAADVFDKLRGGHTNLEELIRTLPYTCIAQMRQLSQTRLLATAKRSA